jgi:3'-phosphoadenosine 5'-phosphosulfate sulfotransferase (PAPS reductase)/FAD synthetase
MKNHSGGSNQRLANLMGWRTKDNNNPVQINNSENKSNFTLEKYRFFLEAPFEISNKCCNVMKKAPIHEYERKTGKVGITAQMAEESKLRTQKWLQNGCNAFDGTKSTCPLFGD